LRIKIELEYAGFSFSGWQEQAGQCTVQGELQRALMIYLASLAKKYDLAVPDPVVIEGSGRTDAGVHARQQVASFDWPSGFELDIEAMRRSLSGISHPDVTVIGASVVSADFHARRSPHIKQYRYRMVLREGRHGLDEHQAWFVPKNVDVAKMIEGARLFCGTHDFSAFRAADCCAPSTERTVVLSELVRKNRDELLYLIEGKGFLKQMVRIIVGTLVDVGRGKLEVEDICRIIESGDRTQAGITAPANGLTLHSVRYV
jgi:tRNA pseudouridine38-40 synthase